MLRAVALGHEPRVGQLVEAPLLEADRKRAQRLRRLLGGERGQHGRVDPAREQHADRHVGDEVGAHGVAHAGAQLLDELRLVLVAHLGRRNRGRPRVPDEGAPSVLPGEDVPGLELPHVAEDRQRRRDGVEGEEGLERVEVDLSARQRAQLGGERELVAGLAVVERLDPVAVAREDEAVSLGVPEGDREHAAQPVREALPVLLVEMDEHLGVAARREAVPGALELVPQLAVVVDLAVLDDRDPAVLVRDRLVARREVDDREPPGREAPPTRRRKAPSGVGPAVDERRAHRREAAGVDGAAGHRDSADPAHAALL